MVTRYSQKSKQKLRKSRPLRTALIALAVVVIAGIIAYIVVHHHSSQPTTTTAQGVRKTNSISYAPSTPQDNAANNTRKSSPPSTSNQTLPGSSAASQSGSGSSENMSVVVTYARVSNGNLQVGTNVTGASSGTCTLTVSQSGQQSITQTENVEQQVNTYACPVFSIPTSKFPNQNAWNVSVSVTSNGSTATGEWQGTPPSP